MEELRTWEMTKINCRVQDIVEGVVQEVGSIDNDKQVDMGVDKELDNEESCSTGIVAEDEELEAGVSLHLTAAAGTAGFIIQAFVQQAATIVIPQVVSSA